MREVLALPGVKSCAHCRWSFQDGAAIAPILFCGGFSVVVSCRKAREKRGECGLEGRNWQREPGADDA